MGRRVERSYSMFKVRSGSREEILLVQGKEQRLHFAGAAVKRYPTSKTNPSKTVGLVRGHQRADRLKPQSQTTSQSNHRTTVLSNSMKLSHALWGHPRWSGHGVEVWQNVVHGRKGMANHFSILALRTPWTVWKGKMLGHWKRNSPGR